jgi:hypothetical protein
MLRYPNLIDFVDRCVISRRKVCYKMARLELSLIGYDMNFIPRSPPNENPIKHIGITVDWLYHLSRSLASCFVSIVLVVTVLVFELPPQVLKEVRHIVLFINDARNDDSWAN